MAGNLSMTLAFPPPGPKLPRKDFLCLLRTVKAMGDAHQLAVLHMQAEARLRQVGATLTAGQDTAD